MRRLHLSLDGKGPQPFEHYIGRLSEEFGGALPSVIWREQQRLPVGFLERIVACRHYAGMKALVDEATTVEARKRLPKTPLRYLVDQILLELRKEEHDRGDADD